MSATAAWTYTNVCTVYPRESDDNWNNTVRYGAPYLINATWEATNTVRDNEFGGENGVQRVVYTECKYNGEFVRAPVQEDYLTLGDTTTQTDPLAAGGDLILTVLENDMSFFGEDPDYEISTFKKWQGG